MDYCAGGSLQAYLFSKKGAISEERMIQIADDIAKGMVILLNTKLTW